MPADQTTALLDAEKPSKSDGEDSSPFSLSFGDISVAVRDGPIGRDPPSHHRVLSCPPDSFEFFCAASEMCFADEVFLGGKLLPLKPRPSAPPPRRPPLDRRRSESLDGHRRRPGGLAEKHPIRLRRAASYPDKKDPLPAAAVKLQPRWYLLVLGPMRVPAAMAMEDIRSRQRRRRTPPTTTGTVVEDGVGRLGNGSGGAWRILRSLSCNGVESAAVVPTPVRFTSHVRV